MPKKKAMRATKAKKARSKLSLKRRIDDLHRRMKELTSQAESLWMEGGRMILFTVAELSDDAAATVLNGRHIQTPDEFLNQRAATGAWNAQTVQRMRFLKAQLLPETPGLQDKIRAPLSRKRRRLRPRTGANTRR